NGQHYLVPHFMIPATHQAMEAYCKKVEFNVHMAHGGVRFPSFQSLVATSLAILGPMLSYRELLSCHAKVKALQNNLGTSYKDANHRLYMTKVEKLEQQDVTLKTYVTLKERMEYNLKSFECRFSDIPIRSLSHDNNMTNPADSHN
ncbi:hypothetical protein L208DRAFT_1266540, partial [Tricholoma matsutake]